jgi:membrane protease YdiL (CAAX protease family)
LHGNNIGIFLPPMLSLHTLGLIAIGAFIVLAMLGWLVYCVARRGWMKHGYFSIPSVILIVLVLFILFQGIGSGVTLALIGEHIETHPIAALSINGLAEIFVLLVGAIAISKTVRQNLLAVFRLEGLRETPVSAYVLAVPIMLLAQFGGSALSVLSEHIWKFFPSIYQSLDHYETSSDESLLGLVTAHGLTDFALIFFFVAIVPALAEEALFRGFTQTNIERSGHWHTRPFVALGITSVLFGLMHASVFKFPGLFALGLTLGWLTYRTNNLFTGALAHITNNGFIVAALYLNPEQVSAKATESLVSTDELSGTDALIVLVPVIVVMALFLYLFNRITANLQSRGNAERELEARLAQENSSDTEFLMNDHIQNHYE